MLTSQEAYRREDERDGFRFRGGRNAIDLPATLQGRLKPVPRELLNSPEDVSRWLVAAGMVESRPVATRADLETARRLREAIYILANSLHGLPGDVAVARDTLNMIAGGTPAIPVLRADGTIQLAGTAAHLLSTLAREAVHMFGSEEAGRIRQCQSATCTLYFVDESRKGDRRWCSMSACGNKAKLQNFRDRQKKRNDGE